MIATLIRSLADARFEWLIAEAEITAGAIAADDWRNVRREIVMCLPSHHPGIRNSPCMTITFFRLVFAHDPVGITYFDSWAGGNKNPAVLERLRAGDTRQPRQDQNSAVFLRQDLPMRLLLVIHRNDTLEHASVSP